jgi:HlyD family secretion protein
MVANAALRWRPSAEQVAPEFREAFEKLAAKKGKLEASAAGTSRAALWTSEGAYVKPIRVRAGLSDGTYTEVQGDGLTEGMNIVTGVQTQTNNQDAATNPFTPKFPPRGGAGRPR